MATHVNAYEDWQHIGQGTRTAARGFAEVAAVGNGLQNVEPVA
jgi:hypothetical protein